MAWRSSRPCNGEGQRRVARRTESTAVGASLGGLIRRRGSAARSGSVQPLVKIGSSLIDGLQELRETRPTALDSGRLGASRVADPHPVADPNRGSLAQSSQASAAQRQRRLGRVAAYGAYN
jgi:hypothetical protein